jgi:hypothetical protein
VVEAGAAEAEAEAGVVEVEEGERGVVVQVIVVEGEKGGVREEKVANETRSEAEREMGGSGDERVQRQGQE